MKQLRITLEGDTPFHSNIKSGIALDSEGLDQEAYLSDLCKALNAIYRHELVRLGLDPVDMCNLKGE
jgi:chromosome condensin MukBEF MukE localization factor